MAVPSFWMAVASASPTTSGTATMGMLGPLLTTRLTAEFLPTEAPDLGFVDRTRPLAVVLVRNVVVPTVKLSFCRV